MVGQKARRALRRARKEIRLGPSARCENCGASDVRVLHRVGGKILCAECRLRSKGLHPFERHHPAGRKNDTFAVPLPANDHAVLSDMQNDWPEKTLRNPERSPLLSQAAAFRANSDIHTHEAEEAETRARKDEHLDAYLSQRLGADWPVDFDAWEKENYQ